MIMNKDFITIGSAKVRVEANWNAITAYLTSTGRDTIDGLAQFSNIAPSDMAALMAACINEGERLEGRESDYTAQSIGEACGMAEVTEFMTIFSKQVNPQLPKEKKE